jgi:hypothetical protein
MPRHLRALAIGVTLATAALTPTAAHASIPAKYANCTNLHAYYPHGVGMATAHDHVAAGGRPVTTWKHDTNAYNTAMRYNRDLDRDRDHVACEKR